ncbi:phospholipid-transporting ATPase ABCA3-like [Leptopilina boulardi]|uniref:phospholipid-transporting ATPase ABCA3-like n=1 Tax=Leptopilina boulardi TaxID=63433 RepID=UPI0021F5A100|nr:phospholipid-transporting ATPase ABCA3-like [Leptopilina boulardi]XP_051164052.1 phospholipid-transporting ATPase ABCA3-like [Leptopilina boulardi]XP_051164053.1 phospholipid-transporting ATPase ABCA3-like [Leptopilina boulardi]
MASGWRVFILLLWKNFIVRRRHWLVSSLIQIGIPLLIFGLTQISRDNISKYTINNNNPGGNIPDAKDKYYPILSKEDMIYTMKYRHTYLYYAPINNLTVNLMNLTAKCLTYPTEKIHGFTSENELLKKYFSLVDDGTFSNVEAIIFKNSDINSKLLSYTIRPEYIYSWYDDNFLTYQTFIPEQMCLDQSFLQIKMNNPLLETNISMQQMPSPAHQEEKPDIDFYMKFMYAMVAVVAFSIQLNVETTYPAQEKMLGVNVLMAMNGVKNYQNLLSWLISGLLFSILYIIPRLILLSICFVSCQPFLHYGNVILVAIMHFLNILHILSFGYHVSSYFSKSILRALAKNFFYFGTFGLQTYFIFQNKFTAIPYMGILFPNMILFRTYEEIDIYEKKLEGVNWNNMFVVGDINYSAAGSLGVMLIFSILGTIIHFFLALYVSAIFPGKYGVAKHPFYFLKFLTLKKNSSRGKICDVNYNSENILFEPVSKDVYVPGIKIRDLKKTYITSWINHAKKQALDGISIDLYEGEITALLGHNGAGKTTMMSILTGLLSPTEGTVLIKGKNIANEMDKIVTDLGLCPQEDILFPDLNVFEQLEFFCMLKSKNKSRANIKNEVDSLMKSLKIFEKRNELPPKLSGGQKRRVCLGMSIIGDASTLILDEPTSGMDPESRREVWDILLKMRGEKTILISTHNMEEADILSDRTAIIELGKLKSYGTPLFLKKYYGEGNMEVTLSTEEEYDIDEIKNQLPEESRLINTDAGKMVFSVPFTNRLPDVLDRIEQEKENLGINGISVSLITLEQVFLRATKEDNENLEDENFSIEKIDNVEGFQRFWQSFIALILKKFLFMRKNIFTHLFMIIIPIISIFTLQSTFNSFEDLEKVSFRLDSYNNPQAFYSSNDDGYGQKYKEIVENLYGKTTQIHGNITEAIMKFGKENYNEYRNNLIVAAQFNIDNNSLIKNANALYSKFHNKNVPIAMNLISNTILKKLLGNEYQIDVSRQKLPLKYNYKFNQTDIVLNYVRAFLLLFCLCSTFALYVIQPLKEAITGLKELQRMTGVTSYLYWGSFFLFDILFFLFTIIIYLIGLYIMDVNDNLQLFHGTELSIMFLLLILFAFNMLPFVYIFSFWKKKTNIIITILTILPPLIVALEAIIFVIMLSTSGDLKKAMDQRVTEKKFFMLIPSVSFFYGQHSFFETAKKNADCRKIPKYYLDIVCRSSKKHDCCALNCSDGVCEKYFPYFNNFEKYDSLEESILYLCLTSFLYFAIVVILEHKLIQKLFMMLKKKVQGNVNDKLDDQVKAEEIYVANEIKKLNKQGETLQTQRNNFFLNGNGENHSIYLAYELSKSYGNLAAVKKISFSVKKRECFGLLGVNGAGKSTTFRLLTGEEFPNSGIMYLNGKDISKNRREYLSQMGYCPQNSALLNSLNSEDHLKLFALLRGVPRSLVSIEVANWIKRLKLNRCSKQPSGTYSGGNKRRLSIAIALIGNPNLVLMDEPTTGVDPAARRYMWHVIKSCQLGGQSIILTSHSMEECEVLCNRLVIMVNGQFVCIGPSEQLKQKFGAGFDINIKLNPERTDEDVQNIKKEIENLLECEHRDEHVGYITYHITNSRTKWKTMYSVMQQLKEKYNCIEDYSILSATLEQLFLQFARADKKPLTVQV